MTLGQKNFSLPKFQLLKFLHIWKLVEAGLPVKVGHQSQSYHVLLEGGCAGDAVRRYLLAGSWLLRSDGKQLFEVSRAY